MSKEITSHFRSVVNWLCLCGNVLLLIILGFHWLRPLDRTSVMAKKYAEEFGMNIHCVNGPFAVFVSKDFPHSDTFRFVDFGQNLQLMREKDDAEDNGPEQNRRVDVSLGPTLNMSCTYHHAGKEDEVNEVTLTTKNAMLTDLNVDGFSDIRIPLNSDKPILEIWYKDKWREAVSGPGLNKNQKQLVGGGVVSFDMKSGSWNEGEKRASPTINNGTSR